MDLAVVVEDGGLWWWWADVAGRLFFFFLFSAVGERERERGRIKNNKERIFK